MSKTQKPSRLESIKNDLFSSEDVVVEAALSKAKKHGNQTLILPLIEVYFGMEQSPLKDQISEMLSSIKVDGAEEPFVEALKDEKFRSIRQNILSFMWNSDLQPVEHIETITMTAIDGDYLTAFEALTLIDNLEGPFPDDQIMGAIVDLSEFQSDNQNLDKSEILNQMISILRGYDTDQ
jgi:hypothetical protein